MLLVGRFDGSGSAVVDICVNGAAGRKSYAATIDTGFSGFVALPLNEMIDLGLLIEGAANVQLGDGSITTSHLSTGSVTLSCTRFRRHRVRCFMEPEVDHGETAVYAGVQA